MIRSCDGCTAHVVMYAHVALAVLMLIILMKMSVLAVPHRKLLTGYTGKHTRGIDET